MDFGDILEQWENKPGKRKKKKEQNNFSAWLDMYPVPDEHINEKEAVYKDKNAFRKIDLKKMKVQNEVDLHGLTVEEAQAILDKFITKSKKQGLKKILIIHGKGTHSQGKPVLKKFVKAYLSNCINVSDFYSAENTDGGTGATIVILKTK